MIREQVQEAEIICLARVHLKRQRRRSPSARSACVRKLLVGGREYLRTDCRTGVCPHFTKIESVNWWRQPVVWGVVRVWVRFVQCRKVQNAICMIAFPVDFTVMRVSLQSGVGGGGRQEGLRHRLALSI